jgi:gamma-glutamyl-gamma-aminobutyrate hydrolase PuuD
MDAQEAKKWLDAKYGNDSSPFIEDDDLINAVAQDLTEFAAAHSAQVEAELYSARSDRDMQIEVRHRAEAELVKLRTALRQLSICGSKMANVMFNLKQNADQKPENRCIFEQLQTEWDVLKQSASELLRGKALGETGPEETK